MSTDTADTAAIIALTLDYAAAIDHRDWALLASIFTDPFQLDMRSVSNRPPSAMSPSAWADRVSSLGRLDATQHLITNHRVALDAADAGRGSDGEARVATCRAEVRAQHWLSAESLAALDQPVGTLGWYELGGHYDCTMVRQRGRWLISGYALTVRWHTGNAGVFALAEQLASRR